MQRREFLATATIAGIAATTQSVRGNVLFNEESVNSSAMKRSPSDYQRYVLLETYRTESVEKRNELIKTFDSHLISDRNNLGFDPVGVFYVDSNLMKSDHGYDASLYDSAVFVVQES